MDDDNIQKDNQRPIISLLKKYEIPINHLDFNYIELCKNPNELEKIVEILKSGEEGYYPDLLKCAELKLYKLKPNSKILRQEIELIRQKEMSRDEWNNLTNEINTWTYEMKAKDTTLRKSIHTVDVDTFSIPPVRSNKIMTNYCATTGINDKIQKDLDNKPRICDYNQWDKYDPDTEILKIDLQEEKNRENQIISYNKNQQNIKKIEEIQTFDTSKLTTIEKEEFSNKYRINGNDLYKIGEYQEAINEYTKSIKILSTAAAYNNRAMCYLKLKQYTNVIDDCNNCLQIDSKNIKALLRKSQAFLDTNNKRMAYETFLIIISIDPNNAIAKRYLEELLQFMKENPPENAFRMKIEEQHSSNPLNNHSVSAEQKEFYSKIKEDHSELIKPKRIVDDKVAKMSTALKETMKSIKDEIKTNKIKKKSNHDDNANDEGISILLPKEQLNDCKKVLIEEI